MPPRGLPTCPWLPYQAPEASLERASRLNLARLSRVSQVKTGRRSVEMRRSVGALRWAAGRSTGERVHRQLVAEEDRSKHLASSASRHADGQACECKMTV